MKRSKRNVILSLLFALCLVFAIFSISYLGVNVNAIENENVETEETTPEVTEKKYIQEDNGFYGELIIRSNGTYYIMCQEKGTGGSTETGEGTYIIREGYYELNLNSSIMEVTVNDELGTWSDYTPPVVPEKKKVFTYEDEEGKIEITILNEEECNIKILPLVGEVREGVFKYKYHEIKEQKYYEIIANKEGESNIYFEVNLENNTFTPIEKPEESHPIRDIKDRIESWVTAFIVALLGNISFFGLARALLSKGNKLLIKKINELEEQNRVTTEQKDAMVNKVNSLQDKVDALAGLNQKLIDVIYEKMDVDQAKVDKTNELLEKVFPKKNGVDLDEIKK